MHILTESQCLLYLGKFVMLLICRRPVWVGIHWIDWKVRGLDQVVKVDLSDQNDLMFSKKSLSLFLSIVAKKMSSALSKIF